MLAPRAAGCDTVRKDRRREEIRTRSQDRAGKRFYCWQSFDEIDAGSGHFLEKISRIPGCHMSGCGLDIQRNAKLLLGVTVVLELR
jgi:hypothetical protein